MAWRRTFVKLEDAERGAYLVTHCTCVIVKKSPHPILRWNGFYSAFGDHGKVRIPVFLVDVIQPCKRSVVGKRAPRRYKNQHASGYRDFGSPLCYVKRSRVTNEYFVAAGHNVYYHPDQLAMELTRFGR